MNQIAKEYYHTQYIGHLVLEILCRYQRIQELSATLDHGVNFTTAPSQMFIIVEGLP